MGGGADPCFRLCAARGYVGLGGDLYFMLFIVRDQLLTAILYTFTACDCVDNCASLYFIPCTAPDHLYFVLRVIMRVVAGIYTS